MSDLAEKLLAAVEALEQLTQADGYASWHIVNCGYDQIEFGASCACAVPAAIQGHCAGDREIVAEVMSWKHFYDGNDEWYSCGLAIDPSGFGGTEPGSGCANDDDRGRCTCSLEARQLRILEPLARGYGVTP